MPLNAIGLVAADLPTTRAFYEQLGCTFDDHPDHVEANLGGVLLMLDREAALRGSGFLTGPSGDRSGVSLAVELASPAEVDAVYADLTQVRAGVRAPFDAPWGQRYATVTDPDGTHVDLYAAN